MSELAALLDRARINGSMSNQPLPLVIALMNALAEATMDFMIKDLTNADKHCRTGFDALWRMIN